MAFFGITQLGSQNIYAASSIRVKNLCLHSDDEFAVSFDRIAASSSDGTIVEDQIRDVLRVVYSSEVPELEIRLFHEAVKPDCNINKAQFMDLVRNVRDKVKLRLELSNVEYTSSKDINDARNRNARLKWDNQDRYFRPLTTSQTIGWFGQSQTESKVVRKGKKICPETKYAAGMVKSGIFYF